MRRKHCGVHNLEFANALFHMGILHADLGKTAIASSYFYQAEQVRQLVHQNLKGKKEVAEGIGAYTHRIERKDAGKSTRQRLSASTPST